MYYLGPSQCLIFCLAALINYETPIFLSGPNLPVHPEAVPGYLFSVAVLLSPPPLFPESMITGDLGSRDGERTFCAMGTT